MGGVHRWPPWRPTSEIENAINCRTPIAEPPYSPNTIMHHVICIQRACVCENLIGALRIHCKTSSPRWLRQKRAVRLSIESSSWTLADLTFNSDLPKKARAVHLPITLAPSS